MHHGYGEVIWSDRRKYVGSFINGIKSDQGTFTWPDEKRYEGSWKNGVQDG